MSFTKTSLKLAVAALLAVSAPSFVAAQGEPIKSSVPRPQEVRALIATLQSASTTQHEKVVACHRLAIIGTKEAVPALAALLGDEKLAHYARHALEPMTEPEAGAALRGALGQLQGSLLIGVVNTIGFRRDAQATAALVRLLDHGDEGISTAAAAALGRIGSVEAAKKLQDTLGHATGARQLALADASLTCADTLVVNRKRTEAAAIYDRMCGSGFPHHIRTAAMCGAITSRESGGIPLLVKQLQGQDRAMLAAGWRAARELKGANVTRALAAELPKLPAEKQVLLVQVLGDRNDRTALPAVLEAANSRAENVRVVALQVLPRVDDGKSGQAVLLRAATAGRSPAETNAALASLAQIGGADTDAKILAILGAVQPAMRVKLIALLGQRRAQSATGELLKLAGGNDAEISKAAFRALAQVAPPSQLPELIRLSTACKDDAVKVPADLAVYAVSMKITPAEKRAEPVLAALRSAPDAPAKCSLLRPLGAIVKATGGSAQALDTITAALNDRDPQVRTAALRCVADWPDARPAALMLDIFKGDPDPVHRELALRGGVRMAASVAAGRDSTKLDALAWLTQANRGVRSKEEKLVIVSGLGSLNRIEGLQMLQPYLAEPAVQTEAELAVMELAQSLAATPHAATARSALEKITKTTKDADVRRRAGKMAKGMQPRT
ncbi:MAG: hypothetical protein Q7S40_07625 [Opitutaceae bacterium]|nr:hypothetical protein [Opitutaceae bacterium]